MPEAETEAEEEEDDEEEEEEEVSRSRRSRTATQMHSNGLRHAWAVDREFAAYQTTGAISFLPWDLAAFRRSDAFAGAKMH